MASGTVFFFFFIPHLSVVFFSDGNQIPGEGDGVLNRCAQLESLQLFDLPCLRKAMCIANGEKHVSHHRSNVAFDKTRLPFWRSP